MRFHRLNCALCAATMSIAFAQTRIDLRGQAKNIDFSTASSTKPLKTGTALPTVCSVGETFFKTDAQPGQNLYACTATGVWTMQGGQANYSMPFTSATTVTVPGTTHKLNTANLLVETYDNATPARRVEPDYVLVNPATYDVTVNFALPQSGFLVINAVGGSGPSAAIYLTTTATLDFTSIAPASCGEMTFALPGAAAGDTVEPAWPSGLEPGLIGNMRVNAAGSIAVRLCNFSRVRRWIRAGASFRATIIRGF